jgi:hypothetical protein
LWPYLAFWVGAEIRLYRISIVGLESQRFSTLVGQAIQASVLYVRRVGESDFSYKREWVCVYTMYHIRFLYKEKLYTYVYKRLYIYMLYMYICPLYIYVCVYVCISYIYYICVYEYLYVYMCMRIGNSILIRDVLYIVKYVKDMTKHCSRKGSMPLYCYLCVYVYTCILLVYIIYVCTGYICVCVYVCM